jgi:hypothetical protein
MYAYLLLATTIHLLPRTPSLQEYQKNTKNGTMHENASFPSSSFDLHLITPPQYVEGLQQLIYEIAGRHQRFILTMQSLHAYLRLAVVAVHKIVPGDLIWVGTALIPSISLSARVYYQEAPYKSRHGQETLAGARGPDVAASEGRRT